METRTKSKTERTIQGRSSGDLCQSCPPGKCTPSSCKSSSRRVEVAEDAVNVSHIPAQTVVTQAPSIAVEDHGLHQKVAESASELDTVLQARQAEANLLAQEQHQKEIIKTVKEHVVDTHEARKQLAGEAERKQAETLQALEEAKHSAKQMMKEAKHQVKEIEAEEHKPGLVERITETFTGSKKSVH